MQVALETVDIQAVYEFILPVSEIESLSNEVNHLVMNLIIY